MRCPSNRVKPKHYSCGEAGVGENAAAMPAANSGIDSVYTSVEIDAMVKAPSSAAYKAIRDSLEHDKDFIKWIKSLQ
jgi:hypothetical protein